jgi:hypothetical protein
MKKGLILITFAWTIEAFAVVAGLVTATVTNFPSILDGEFNESKWKLLMLPPMVMVALAELGRIPLTSVLYERHKRMQIVALIGITVLAGIAFENWFLGFERIVEQRLKPVSAAALVQSRKEDELADKEKQRAEAGAMEAQARDEFREEREANEDAIAKENKAHRDNIDAATKSCLITPRGDQCMVTELRKENNRHKDAMDPLLQQRDDINRQVKERVKIDTKVLDAEIAKLRLDVTAAKKETKEQKLQNQIYRIAAMVYWVEGGVANVTDRQYEVVRLWFCAFSAMAISLAGVTAALVYYAAAKPREKYGSFDKMIAGIRAYFVRKRRKTYVVQYRDGVQFIDKPVPVRQPHLVLVPWFTKYPMQIGLKDGRVQMLKVMEEELKDEVEKLKSGEKK